jgi:hypothetical protein
VSFHKTWASDVEKVTDRLFQQPVGLRGQRFAALFSALASLASSPVRRLAGWPRKPLTSAFLGCRRHAVPGHDAAGERALLLIQSVLGTERALPLIKGIRIVHVGHTGTELLLRPCASARQALPHTLIDTVHVMPSHALRRADISVRHPCFVVLAANRAASSTVPPADLASHAPAAISAPMRTATPASTPSTILSPVLMKSICFDLLLVPRNCTHVPAPVSFRWVSRHTHASVDRSAGTAGCWM